MVKFGKNKLKALNKIAKKQKLASGPVSNKVLKKKNNAEKKVAFQKEVLSQMDVANSPLVKNITKQEIKFDKTRSRRPTKTNLQPTEPAQKPKLKPVKKQKQRQKIQISDTKLLLNLMNKK